MSRRRPMFSFPFCGSSPTRGRASLLPFSRELAEKPWVHRWWCQVLGCMHRLSIMPDGSLHVDILRDNVAAAQHHSSWQLGCWCCPAIPSFGHALTFLIFWHCNPELAGVPSKAGGSASQGLGWSACMPQDGPLQGGQAVYIFCMGFPPEPVALRPVL